jgi:predicted alpha/beta superfamily hydrolase
VSTVAHVGFTNIPRTKDTVTRAKEPEPIGKQLPMYIGTEVLPYVSARYRVTSEAGRTGIGGASMGGAAALYVLLKRLDLFSLGLIESPSLQIGNGQLLRDTSFLVLGPDRVYIGVGMTEFAGGGEQMASKMRLSFDRLNAAAVKMSETLATNLKTAYVNEPDVRLTIEPNATHTQLLWARRFPAAITFLYGKHVRKQ